MLLKRGADISSEARQLSHDAEKRDSCSLLQQFVRAPMLKFMAVSDVVAVARPSVAAAALDAVHLA